MTGDRLPTYGNLVPDSVLEGVAKQVLGARLFAWSKAEGTRLCATFEKMHGQLCKSISDCTEERQMLELGDFEVPKGENPPDREDYKRERLAQLDTRMRENIASLDKLTGIYLKLSAGGASAMLQGLKQVREIPPDNNGSERNVTPRRRYGAGLSYVESR